MTRTADHDQPTSDQHTPDQHTPDRPDGHDDRHDEPRPRDRRPDADTVTACPVDAPSSVDTPSSGGASRVVGRQLWLRRRWLVAVAVLAVGAVAAGVAAANWGDATPAPDPGTGAGAPLTADPLGADIAGIQAQLKITPNNAASWATLGLDYVQEAKNTVNPMYYPKAEGALARSLQIQPAGNAAGLNGMAALRAAQHRFADALALAQQAQALDPQNSTIYGTLADADTQLGRYDEARTAVQRMLDLHPGTPAYTRAEYVYELNGQLDQARALMTQALTDATTPADLAFCRYYLAELAFDNGDPAQALHQIQLGLLADPRYPDLLAGQAKAEAALGQQAAAIADYAQVVASVPQPQYVIEAGEYLQSIGRTAAAHQDYQLFDAENTLFTSNGVQLDTDPTLFYADHGDPAKALQYGQAGIRIRPFLEMDDAYAWALHVNGRDADALTWSQKATATGMRNALFAFHQGMIENSLGQRDAARTDLTAALAINPHFNFLQVPVARATLATLGRAR